MPGIKPKSLFFAKNTVTTDKPHFHGNQWMIPVYLSIPSLLASFKMGLSESRVVKFRYFLRKEERNSKVSPRKVEANSVYTFGQFLQFSFLPFTAVVHVQCIILPEVFCCTNTS